MWLHSKKNTVHALLQLNHDQSLQSTSTDSTTSASSKMSEPNITTIPLQEFKGHEERVGVVAVFPDKQRMVTASHDRTLRIWDLKKGIMLKKIEGHGGCVSAMAVSRDGQLIASGDLIGVVTIWHGETGERLTGNIENYVRYTDYNRILSLDFSPDGKVLATGSTDKSLKLWCTETWKLLGNSIHFDDHVSHVRYSPSGELLAIAAAKVEIYSSSTRKCIAKLEAYATYIAWTPDGTRLISASLNGNILEWDTLTWQQISNPWMTGHTDYIRALAIDPNSTLIASGASDHIRLWQLSDRKNVAIFQQSSASLTFSLDGKHILSGSYYTDNNSVTKWAVDPKVPLQEEGASYGIDEAILFSLAFFSLFIFGNSLVDFLHLRHLISRKGALLKDPPENKVKNDVSWC
jgi:WD40 repeat protein